MATVRFRIFRTPINAKVSTVKSVKIVGLHNFLMEKTHKGDNQYYPLNYIDREENDHVLPGKWRQEQNHISDFKDDKLSATSLKAIS